ncbi:hypothetical protein RhiXN_07266 [Rhizoctonia solani]|uniref:Uncharacterized protein n=1 Tax=Rhizoctonia solani TaxID=456999 RepID=A0A8H8T203_9AGAM|nr:uncharacterized protein RhiXN_07266 [Rhizoctonia solani]QRW25317.1 hypothetical protein RhiXN_07266 [Rhizoctonia solani]
MDEYEYSWKPSAGMSIDEFLQKYKPTMVFDDGTKPWIWVRRLEHEPLDSVNSTDIDSTRSDTSIIERGQKLLEITQERSRTFKYYRRFNREERTKKQEGNSEETATEATEKFKQLCQESGLTSGKLLFFVQAEHIDGAFSRIARDLITGALSKTLLLS